MHSFQVKLDEDKNTSFFQLSLLCSLRSFTKHFENSFSFTGELLYFMEPKQKKTYEVDELYQIDLRFCAAHSSTATYLLLLLFYLSILKIR